MRRFFKVLPLLALVVGCSPNNKNTSIISEESFDLVMASMSIEWKDILCQNCNDYYVYVYSLTCHYCNSIKSEVYSFCLRNAVFFVEYQQGVVPLGSEMKDFNGIANTDDLYILGTPTLFHIKEKIVNNCYIGANQISVFFDYQNGLLIEGK